MLVRHATGRTYSVSRTRKKIHPLRTQVVGGSAGYADVATLPPATVTIGIGRGCELNNYVLHEVNRIGIGAAEGAVEHT